MEITSASTHILVQLAWYFCAPSNSIATDFDTSHLKLSLNARFRLVQDLNQSQDVYKNTNSTLYNFLLSRVEGKYQNQVLLLDTFSTFHSNFAGDKMTGHQILLERNLHFHLSILHLPSATVFVTAHFVSLTHV